MRQNAFQNCPLSPLQPFPRPATLQGLPSLFCFPLSRFLRLLVHFNLLEKIIHCMENTNIVHNAKEWDDGKGDAVAHGRRMQSNWKENVVTIIIKAFFNIGLLLPLCYLGDFEIST